MIAGMADDTKQEAAAPSVGRVVHFHPKGGPVESFAAVVVALAPEGGDGAVDLFVLPTRYSAGTVVQAVRHDDEADDADDDLRDATDEERAAYYARGRTSQLGSWGWPPRV